LGIKKISLNIKRIREYLNFLSKEELNKLFIDYPTIIANFKNIERIEFYMNLYYEMSKEDFHKLVTRNPLLLIADVIIFVKI
jgi:hypothetical protein